jgi:hypothetical protein
MLATKGSPTNARISCQTNNRYFIHSYTLRRDAMLASKGIIKDEIYFDKLFEIRLGNNLIVVPNYDYSKTDNFTFYNLY